MDLLSFFLFPVSLSLYTNSRSLLFLIRHLLVFPSVNHEFKWILPCTFFSWFPSDRKEQFSTKWAGFLNKIGYLLHLLFRECFVVVCSQAKTENCEEFPCWLYVWLELHNWNIIVCAPVFSTQLLVMNEQLIEAVIRASALDLRWPGSTLTSCAVHM